MTLSDTQVPDDGAPAVPDDGAPTPPSGTSSDVLDLLEAGVPMTLIADLADPAGPPSPVILEEEGLPEDASWVPERAPAEQGLAGADDDALERDP